ncbi:MAG: SseB family protein [Elusimicrobiota bacterium]
MANNKNGVELPVNPELDKAMDKFLALKGDLLKSAAAFGAVCAALAKSRPLVGVRALPEELRAARRVVESDQQLDFLLADNGTGETALLVFSDIGALKAHDTVVDWLELSPVQLIEFARQEKFNALLINIAGQCMVISSDYYKAVEGRCRCGK